jgi:hypothetical protein
MKQQRTVEGGQARGAVRVEEGGWRRLKGASQSRPSHQPHPAPPARLDLSCPPPAQPTTSRPYSQADRRQTVAGIAHAASAGADEHYSPALLSPSSSCSSWKHNCLALAAGIASTANRQRVDCDRGFFPSRIQTQTAALSLMSKASFPTQSQPDHSKQSIFHRGAAGGLASETCNA